MTPKNHLLKLQKWGAVIILAGPQSVASDVTKAVGSAADGKNVIDVSNGVTGNMSWRLVSQLQALKKIGKFCPKRRS